MINSSKIQQEMMMGLHFKSEFFIFPHYSFITSIKELKSGTISFK